MPDDLRTATKARNAQPGDRKSDPGDDTTEALHEHLVEHEVEEIADHSRLRVPQIYQVVRHEGETEMARPAVALWGAGGAGGVPRTLLGFLKGGAAKKPPGRR